MAIEVPLSRTQSPRGSCSDDAILEFAAAQLDMNSPRVPIDEDVPMDGCDDEHSVSLSPASVFLFESSATAIQAAARARSSRKDRSARAARAARLKAMRDSGSKLRLEQQAATMTCHGGHNDWSYSSLAAAGIATVGVLLAALYPLA